MVRDGATYDAICHFLALTYHKKEPEQSAPVLFSAHLAHLRQGRFCQPEATSLRLQQQEIGADGLPRFCFPISLGAAEPTSMPSPLTSTSNVRPFAYIIFQ
jgi:hypothetical protein